MNDPMIDRLEAEINESRFTPWDVETFLAKRHRAKFEALTAPATPKGNFGRWVQVGKEVSVIILAGIGFVTVNTVLGLWLVTGQYPLP